MQGNQNTLALAFFPLPFSNASVERIFSLMNCSLHQVKESFECKVIRSNTLGLPGITCESTEDMVKNFSAKGNAESDYNTHIKSLELDVE